MEQEQQCLSVTDDAVAQQGPRALLGGAATVSGGTRDTEGDVIGQTQWQAIREAKAGGKTVSAIAREMGLDRKTVRAALHSEHWRPYSRSPRPSKLDEHMAWLSERAPQVNFSARILHQELRLQRDCSRCVLVSRLAAPTTVPGRKTPIKPSPSGRHTTVLCSTASAAPVACPTYQPLV